MADAAGATSRDELVRQIERIRPDTQAYSEVRLPEAPGLERKQQHSRIAAPAEREAFGRWLLAQRDRGDWIDALASAARADRAFPKDGDPDEVRKHLTRMGAEGDMFERLDDAETDWLSY